MQKILWALTLAAALCAEERYSIQVISAQDEASITEAFMAKVKQTSMPYVQKRIDGKYKIFVGKFPSHEAAASLLPQIREKVSGDAFIAREGEMLTLKPEANLQKIMVQTEAKMLQPPKTEEQAPEAKSSKTEALEISRPREKVLSAKKEIKENAETKGKNKEEEMFCKPSRKALREAEISAAISFYKDSSFYSFK